MASRAYDLVIWGGSGFTGRLAAEYLARRYTPGSSDPAAVAASEPVRWAIAGRDRAKLERVRDGIMKKHPNVKSIDILVGKAPCCLSSLSSSSLLMFVVVVISN